MLLLQDVLTIKKDMFLQLRGIEFTDALECLGWCLSSYGTLSAILKAHDGTLRRAFVPNKVWADVMKTYPQIFCV